MLIALYNIALTAGLLLSAPWWVTRMLTTDRYREGLPERLGRVPLSLIAAVAGKQVVWLHAVSVGEVLAASRLVKELGEALPKELHGTWCVVVSTTTRTGQALARERFGPERVFYFPLDLGWAVHAYLRSLRPSLLVLMESELWPRLLHECERAGIPVAVVNARVSDRSFRRASRIRGLWVRLLGKVTLWLAQGDADAARLRDLGAKDSAVHVSGNLKYDIRAPRESRLPGWIRDAAAGRPIVVAGSTTEGLNGEQLDEEQRVLAAWRSTVQSGHPSLLVLAPRHPERFGLVESHLTNHAYAKASHWIAAGQGTTPAPPEMGGPPERLDILLLDTIGDLAAVYALADIAFVGGSLVKRGGHNPLEPAQFGVPVLLGPSFENFREIVTKLRAADALCDIEDVDELGSAMLSLLSDPAGARALGERARQIFEQEGGATARTVQALLPLLRQVTQRKGGELSGPAQIGQVNAAEEARA